MKTFTDIRRELRSIFALDCPDDILDPRLTKDDLDQLIADAEDRLAQEADRRCGEGE